MFALLGIIGLMVSIYVRPYEWNADLATFPFLHLFCGVALLGLAFDFGMRRSRYIPNPLLPWCAFLAFWCLITLGIAEPSVLSSKASPILISLLLFSLIAHGVQTVKAFSRLVLTIFALGIFVAYVGVDQSFHKFSCLISPPEKDNQRPFPDGRLCEAEGDIKQEEAVAVCYTGPEAKKGVKYLCEKPGMFTTSSIDGGRIRYLGVLSDPNELALATSLALPIAFALFERKRSTLRLLLLLGSLGLVGYEVVNTKSRGGQIVFGMVLGSYFVRKYGIKRGVIIAGIFTGPLVMMGGRSGEAADQSAIDRLEAAAAAIKLLISYPIKGCGYSQFLEHHPLTAHNAYLLAASELGWPGLLSFFGIIYLSGKTMFNVLRFEFDEDDPEAAPIKTFAMAMLAAFAGITIGVFFLSWTYHFVLWIHFGLAGALYTVVRNKYPNFYIRMSGREFGLIFVAWIFILIAFTIHIKRKGCW